MKESHNGRESRGHTRRVKRSVFDIGKNSSFAHALSLNMEYMAHVNPRMQNRHVLVQYRIDYIVIHKCNHAARAYCC